MATSTETVLEHHDATVPTLVYKPDGDGPHPAIVLAAEAYGLNQFTRGVAERLRDGGYVVIVPDYYRGNGLTRPDDYTDFTEVMEFIGNLDFTGAATTCWRQSSMPDCCPKSTRTGSPCGVTARAGR